MNYSRAVRCYRRQLILKKMRAYLYRILAVAVLIALWCNPYRPILYAKMDYAAGKIFNVALADNAPAAIIHQAIPFMVNDEPAALLPIITELSPKQTELAVAVLSLQMPLLKEVKPLQETAADIEPSDKQTSQPEKQTNAVLDGPALVAIYNTHTGETYALTDGVDRLTGKRGGVVKVAEAIQKRLEQKHKIKVVRSDTIHDANYNNSYIESEKTVKQLLEENKDLKLIFDVHRDNRPREDCITTINGQTVARVLIIVGSDARAPFPEWKQNLATARQLDKKMDEMYPGLSLGIRVKEGRYNQYYHTGALLVEVGVVENTTEEAVAAGELFADAVAAYLEDTANEQAAETLQP